MPSQKIKRMPLYIDSIKLGEVQNFTVTWNNNNERADGFEGVVGSSDGNQHVEVDCTTVVPETWSGAGDRILLALQSQQEVAITIPFAGRQWKVPMKVNSGSLTSTSQTGMLTGSWKFINTAPPQVV